VPTAIRTESAMIPFGAVNQVFMVLLL